MFRDPDGSLVLQDKQGWRRIDVVTGLIGPAQVAPADLPPGALGDGSVSRSLRAGRDVYHFIKNADEFWIVRVSGTGEATELYRRALVPVVQLLGVRPDGGVIFSAYGGYPEVGTTESVGPAGGAATVVLQHPSKLAAAATDGTVYAVPLGGDRIERVGPGGQVDVVAGPGVANSPDGTAATATGMDVAALAVTPDGDRVVYLDGHPSFDTSIGMNV